MVFQRDSLAWFIERVYDRGMLAATIDSLQEFIDAQADADRERAQRAIAAANLERSGVWAVDGWSSFNTWAQDQTHTSRSHVYRQLHEGRFLCRFPTVGDAALSGLLSASLVSLFQQAVAPSVYTLFDADQVWLVPLIAPLHPIEAAKALAEWRTRADEATDTPAEFTHADRMLQASRTLDGGMVGQFAFDEVGAEIIEKALETARTWDKGDERTQVQTLADAMQTIAAFFNANHEAEGTPRHHAHTEWVMQTKDHDTLFPGCSSKDCTGHNQSDPDALFVAVHATTLTSLSGVVMPDWAAAAILCDCTINRVITAKSAVLDYGTTVYTPPRDLFRAVASRDKGCRFPGCRREVKFTEAHHIIAWPGGPTAIHNLILLCSYHHHLVHRMNWTIELVPDDPDAAVIFTGPD
jgi:hypothetical protein